MVPKAELEGDMGDSHVGLQARLMSQALRKLTASISKSGTAVIFINQIREFDIMFNEGISKEGDLLDLAVASNIVKKSGAFYSFGEIQIGRGRQQAKVFLKENPVLTDEIEELVENSLTPDTLNDVVIPSTEEDVTIDE